MTTPDRLDYKKPPKPEDLVGALQDPIHQDIGKSRVVRAARKRAQAKPDHYTAASPEGVPYLRELLPESATTKDGFFDGDLLDAVERHIPALNDDAMLFSAAKYFWRLGTKEGVSVPDDLKKARHYLLKALELRDKWWFPLARLVARKIAKKRIKKVLRHIGETLND